MTDELYEATKREVMTEEEEYRNADVPMPKKQELDKDFIEHLEKFFKGKKIIDRDRGTSPAVLRSSGPKQRPERVATTLGVSGESVRRDVPADENEKI